VSVVLKGDCISDDDGVTRVYQLEDGLCPAGYTLHRTIPEGSAVPGVCESTTAVRSLRSLFVSLPLLIALAEEGMRRRVARCWPALDRFESMLCMSSRLASLTLHLHSLPQ
jgi:hypothetical protein